jgi:serine/threonine protein kinase
MFSISTSVNSSELRPVAQIAFDVASGLEFIHSHGAVHRDLKPRNGMYKKAPFQRLQIPYTNSSTLLREQRLLENRRFRHGL